jgi:hypothetical protein
MKAFVELRFKLLVLFSLLIILLGACSKKTSRILSEEQFIHYTVNGVTYNYDMPQDSISHGPDSLETPSFLNRGINIVIGSRIPNTTNSYAYICFDNTAISVGSIQTLLNFYMPETSLAYTQNIPVNATSPVPVMVNITEYGLPGEYIAGNFTAVFTSPAPTSVQFNVQCSFRIKRVN